ncbi:MAG: molecular chaperone [Enterobacteriaceae bacterium]|jgi:P pilus assembly chaperone PapD|nr:molecular chaperone [Enterobacteriaceae bacterium]
MMNTRVFNTFLLTLSLLAVNVQAGIIASATRVIFNEGDTEKSLMLLNTNTYPVITQTWVDNGDVNNAPELSQAPFVPLPSVFALQPNAYRGIKIVYNGQALPADRESVFWLNLYEVPPTQPITPPMQSRVTLAMNTQMKIFYRPKTLADQAQSAADKITFTLLRAGNHYQLRCNNSSAFYLSFASIAVHIGEHDYPVQQESDMMTAPFSSKDYQLDKLPDAHVPTSISVNAALIDELGQQQMKTYALTY